MNNDERELKSALIDFYMLNTEELAPEINPVLNDLTDMEKRAVISFLNNIHKNLSE